MGDAYRGLTIRIGADTSPVERSLKNLRSATKATQNDLRKISNALKDSPQSAELLASKVRTLGDSAHASAEKFTMLGRSVEVMAKNSGGMAKLISSTRNAESSAKIARNAYNQLDRELEHCYDTLIEFYMVEKKMTMTEATESVRKLRNNAKLSAEAFAYLSEEMQRAFASGKVKLPLGTKDAEQAIAMWRALRVEQRKAQKELTKANNLVGIKNAIRDMQLYKAELVSAEKEMVKLRAAELQLGTGKAKKAAIEIEQLDKSVEEARHDLASANHLLEQMPTSIDAALYKMRAVEQLTSLWDKQLTEAETRLRSLDGSSLSSVLAKFKSTGNAVRVVGEQLANARARCRELEHEFALAQEHAHKVGVESGYTSKEFKEACNRATELRNKLKGAYTEVSRLTKEFNTVNGARAFESTNNMVTKLRANLASTEKALSRVKRSWSQFGASVRTAGYSLSATLGSAAMMVGLYSIQAAKDTDSAYRNMRKTVNGTEEEFEHLREAALKFSQTHFTSAAQLLEIEAIGGQLGIAASNLETFSEVVSNTDIATNLDAETIATNLGQLCNIMKDMNQDIQKGPGSMDAYSNALVRLGNNSAAQEDTIQNVMMRIASMGTICDMTTPDLLALATAIASTGQGAESSGTAISKTFSNIESAVNGSASAMDKLSDASDLTEDEIADLQEAVEAGEGKLEAFAEVAGMSAQEFADAWNGERPMEAFKAFIEGLKKIDESGGSVDSTLKSLGINADRQKRAIMGLVNTVGTLDNSLTMSNDAWNGISDEWGAAGDAAREADRKSEGFSGQLEILTNNARALATQLTDSLTPSISWLGDATGVVSNIFGLLPGSVRNLVSLGGALSFVAGPMAIFGGSAISGVSAIKKFALGQKDGMSVVKHALEDGSEAMLASSVVLDRHGNQIAKNIPLTTKMGNAVKSMGNKISESGKSLSNSEGKLAKYGTSITRLGTAVSGLTSVHGIAFAAIAAIVGAGAVAIKGHLDKIRDKTVMESKAFEDMSTRINNALDRMEGKTDNALGTSAQAAFDKYEKYVKELADGNDKLAEKADEVAESIYGIEKYGSGAVELLSRLETNGKLSNYEFDQLKTVIKEFNTATGESIQVIKDEDGNIQVLNGDVKMTADSFRDLANAKKIAAQADYWKEGYNNAYEKEMSAGILRQETETALNDAEARKKSIIASKDSYDSWNDYQNALAEVNGEINGLQIKLRGLSADEDNAAKEARLQGEMWDLMSSKAAQTAGTIENLIASNTAAQSAFVDSGNSVADFVQYLNEFGLEAKDLEDVDLANIINKWNGSLTGLIKQLTDAGVKVSDTALELAGIKNIELGDKTFTVTSNGTVEYEGEKLGDLDLFTIDGKSYTVDDNGTIQETTYELKDLNKMSLADKVVLIKGDRSPLDKMIEDLKSEGPISLVAKVTASVIGPKATGGYVGTVFPHAAGGYFVDKPTIIGRTGNVTHIAGEAGKEYVSTYAGGGVVLPLTNPNMRPWVNAVAQQMSGFYGSQIDYAAIGYAVASAMEGMTVQFDGMEVVGSIVRATSRYGAMNLG